MRQRIILTILGMVSCCMAICHAQKINMDKARAEMDEFVKGMTDDFNNFRRNSMAQFAEFVKNPWKEFEESKPVPKPDIKEVPPIIMEDKDIPIEDKPVIIEEIVKPVIEEPQPQPIEPIDEVPIVTPSYIEFEFFGTYEKVRCNRDRMPTLDNVSENAISLMLTDIATEDNDNMILDCLDIRKNRQLSDWAYIQMLDKLASAVYKDRHNEAQLLLSYIYLQSGYKMRLASDGNNLYMLFASKHMIFDKSYYHVDGEYYYGLKEMPGRLRICQCSFPGEQPLSLSIATNQLFTINESDSKCIKSKRYPDIAFNVSVNKNLIDFYSTYPASTIDGNFMTRWAMYANTPLDNNISSTLYSGIRIALKGKNEFESTAILLNTLQTGFVYGYDSKIWGYDRAFFAEETLYFPYCDCEDRSILFSRMVRDLLGLEVVLVYYPGHLATAVHFNTEVKGDYISLNGKKFTICDPTYIGAPVGKTMPDLDNKSATVILLK